MRAFVIERHGGPDVLCEVERVVPFPGLAEVSIRVLAVALNHLDLWVRRGVPGHTFPLPIVPGCDVVGRITAVGPDVTESEVGRLVVLSPGLGCGSCIPCLADREHFCRQYGIFGETRDGGCAEEMCVPARALLPFPDNLSIVEAAAVPLTLLTAWHMLVDRAKIRADETVLIHAGGSGVGVMAIQIARLFGARVATTVGSDEKALLARALGAEEVILHREADFSEAVRRWTAKRGVDVILDHVGEDTFERNVRALARGGRLVICGSTSGAGARFDLRQLFFKGLSILGSTMGSRAELLRALEYVRSGALRPVVDRVFPMAELPAAHEWLEGRRAFGKVVVAGYGEALEDIRDSGR